MAENYRQELKQKLDSTLVINYDQFDAIFLDVFNKHAPSKKKVFRANHKPYMTKMVRKAIMKR